MCHTQALVCEIPFLELGVICKSKASEDLDSFRILCYMANSMGLIIWSTEVYDALGMCSMSTYKVSASIQETIKKNTHTNSHTMEGELCNLKPMNLMA